MNNLIVILPSEFADRIASCDTRSGILDIRADRAEGVFVVDGFTRGQNRGGIHGGSAWVNDHYLGSASRQRLGVWYMADEALHAAGLIGAHKSGMLRLEAFKDGLYGSWIGPSRGGSTIALTYTKLDTGDRDWQAWELSVEQEYARLVPIEVVDEQAALLAPLAPHWPLDDLRDAHVVVIGAGSIGSHADDALVAFGVRRLTLVDPDRLLVHNFARHRAHRRDLGKFKVTAEHQRLLDRDPNLTIEALRLDVIYDADAMRPLFADADLVFVTADGINSRRTANHIARRAGTPAVFACVLENGAYGEIIRVHSEAVGCLLCARDDLRERGGIEPETSLDRGYGAGTRHLPMTAVSGDLALVGQFAAKVAVATLLEAKGHRDQRLPGEQVIISLRPRPDTAAPFDAEVTGVVKWERLPQPRADCPTCRTS